MNKKYIFLLCLSLLSFLDSTFCAQNDWEQKADHAALALLTIRQDIPDSLLAYMENIRALCGKAFEGQVVHAPEGDTAFIGKRLIMEVRYCEDDMLGIPFHVGDDRSRTWILTVEGNRLLLKHDHRHEDGSHDDLTMYGGLTNNQGLSTRQTFPADDETYAMIPEASSNVWMMEIIPGKSFTYMLHRLGTGRLFIVEFDLTKTVENPPAAWGWE